MPNRAEVESYSTNYLLFFDMYNIDAIITTTNTRVLTLHILTTTLTREIS